MDVSRARVVIVAEWLAIFGTLIAFVGGVGLSLGVGYDDRMDPGFPLFCCAAVCMLVGLLASWPKIGRHLTTWTASARSRAITFLQAQAAEGRRSPRTRDDDAPMRSRNRRVK